MTYVEGPTLREYLARVSRMSVPETVRLAGDLLDALDHAHGHGIVHRDVKPDNVVARHPQGAVLLDFGIARAVAASGSDRLTRSGIAVGTSTYMSPEQISALQEIDRRSDIYSLGCVLFECLAGQPPFINRNEAVVLQQHLTQPAPDLRTLRPEMPAELAIGDRPGAHQAAGRAVGVGRGHARRAHAGAGRLEPRILSCGGLILVLGIVSSRRTPRPPA